MVRPYYTAVKEPYGGPWGKKGNTVLPLYNQLTYKEFCLVPPPKKKQHKKKHAKLVFFSLKKIQEENILGHNGSSPISNQIFVTRRACSSSI